MFFSCGPIGGSMSFGVSRGCGGVAADADDERRVGDGRVDWRFFALGRDGLWL